ncbi:MAG TPA: hypothetical protein VGF48_06085 [Thermoanaerobaculia bacterium]|jgi:hypothetical protein
MSETAAPPAEPHPVRLKLVQHGGRFAYPLPDAILAVLFSLAALIDFLPSEALVHVPFGFVQRRVDLIYLLVVEGGFLMMQAALVDVATRLRKRPPVWVAVLIVAVIALFSAHSFELLAMAWQQGMMVFLPLLLSVAERGTVLWHMPTRTRIQKIAARALVSNRITAGLGLLGVFAVTVIVTMATDSIVFPNSLPFVCGALYYAIATYDDFRVKGRRFAEKPRVLFLFDPIHIEYLEPV